VSKAIRRGWIRQVDFPPVKANRQALNVGSTASWDIRREGRSRPRTSSAITSSESMPRLPVLLFATWIWI
jgi:hypothetical protein